MSNSNIPPISINQTKKLMSVLILVGSVLSLIWIIWGFRINVGQNKILVLTRKFGSNPAPGQILAFEKGHKGVQYAVKSEGWHWYNSFLWKREIMKATLIDSNKLGVLTRLYGSQLPEGEMIASDYNPDVAKITDTKGIVPQILKPGKYNINPYAYRVEIVPRTNVPPGHVGIVLQKMGKPAEGFDYLTKDGLQGVQLEVKPPGSYFLNPYIYEVINYNVRMQKTDFDGSNALSFMSFDSYEIRLTASIEWRVSQDRAAEVYGRIGDIKQVERKIIVPYARSLCRMIGSESLAKDYISGDSRMSIQDRFKDMLEARSKELGIDIQSVVIKKIIPPTVLREIINKRGLERETRQKLLKEIDKVKSDARVAKGREEIKKSQGRVEEKILHKKLMTKVIGDREIALKNAKKNLAIAKVELEVAEVEKDTIIEKGKASIIQEYNIREAEVRQLTDKITALGGGDIYAAQVLFERIQLESVLAGDKSPFANIFQEFLNLESKGGAQ